MTDLNESPDVPVPAEAGAALHATGSAAPRCIVGIGASAGGLAAFITFLTHMPPDSGLALVLVQHLDPQHLSLLPELLAPHTAMPVHPVVDRMPVAPDQVYLIPPNTTLTIDQGVLCLVPPVETHGHRMPIDRFFQSLAADQGPRAIGVILSGAGTDGTLGLTAIKEAGGMTMVQAPETAQADSMPQSAISRRVVDHVLPIAQMPAALLAYVAHGTNHRLPSLSDSPPTEASAELSAICTLLRQTTGHDFSHYKPATLLRRIARRMQVVHSDGVAEYVERLRQDRPEVERLFQDLLISVTQFFRDPAAFDALAHIVIPNLFRAKAADTPLRIWVPGCATGEEAYSIAILVREHMAGLATPPPVQLFATDIDELALDVARRGRYAEGIAAHLSDERLARFFVSDGHGYQVSKAIRELCLFSTHNLISDPPFARMDLIVCRNLLIYFDADLQQRLFPLLHYALVPQGYLFLGAAESVAAHRDGFRTVDKPHRIFQRTDLLSRSYVEFPLGQTSRRPVRRAARPPDTPPRAPDIGATLDRILLRHYTPPAVLINDQGVIVYFSGHTSAYLEAPPGAPTLDILAMVHPQLRLALHTAIRTARQDRAPVIHDQLRVETNQGVQRLSLIVRPLSELGPDSDLLLIVFQEIGPPVSAAQAQEAGFAPQPDEPLAQQLAQELQTTREALETTIAELQEANAELTAANEELLSINEEFQSANEELQTSQEEIQSINEELQTVNAELSRKVEELDRTNADLANFFASTQIPAIFLHADGRIARFTPAATEVFRLIESDIDRPIVDITARFHDGDLMELITTVLRTLIPHEETVRRPESDVWWIMRIRPYRTLANVIDGVVVIFFDITTLKRVEIEREQLLQAVQQARNYAERIVETVGEPLLILDAELRIQSANRAFYQAFALTPAETQQTLLSALDNGAWDRPELRTLFDQLGQHPSEAARMELTLTEPQAAPKTLLLHARQIEHLPDAAPLILLAIADITERTQAAALLQEAHDALESRVQTRTRELAATNAALRAEIAERARSEQARQVLLHQLVTAQEEERRRIARELHDQLGQDLTALVLGLKALQDATEGAPVGERVRQLQALAMQLGQEVRTLAVQLRPPALDDLGLAITLANYVDQWEARAQVAVDFHSTGLDDARLPLAVETTLYRLVQEALTNVLKHAQATRVSLIIERRADEVRMIVEDDGVGFDRTESPITTPTGRQLGLIGMTERVAYLSGTLAIEASPGRGTSVFVRIPLIADRQGGTDGDTPDFSGR